MFVLRRKNGEKFFIQDTNGVIIQVKVQLAAGYVDLVIDDPKRIFTFIRSESKRGQEIIEIQAIQNNGDS